MPVTDYYTINGRIIGETTTGSTRLDYVRDALGSQIGTFNQGRSNTSSARYKPCGDVLDAAGPQPYFGWNGTSGYLRSAGVPH
jgi:hypothetical protein